MRRFGLAIALSLLVPGCSAGRDMEAAQAEVAHFHQQLDGGRFAEIYAAAGSEIRKDMDQVRFTAFLDAVHTRLGTVRQSTIRSWNVNYGTGGNFVTLIYDTQLSHGRGEETFVYRTAGGKTQLAGYHIKSNDWVLN
ncbi:MAG TPA: hypothetical protein VJ859_15180 [Allosphingosinicella sp.]|nr:hypothetical protein [Allosphingosinicella sp.]